MSKIKSRLTPEVEADLRTKINPQYADWQGTESWERKTLFEEIDRVRAQRDEALEALAPFVALLQPHNDRNYSGSDSTPIFGVNDAQITLGDLRRARDLITMRCAEKGAR